MAAGPAESAMPEPRRPMPEPTYHWPGGPTADDDPTPAESALAALKIGAILAAAVTIVFFYLATYSGYRAPRAGASLGSPIVDLALDAVLGVAVALLQLAFELFAARRIGWGGRRAAYLSALGFAIVLLNFVPISYFLTRSHDF